MALPPINFTGSSSAKADQNWQALFRDTHGGSIYEFPSMGQLLAIGAVVLGALYVMRRG